MATHVPKLRCCDMSIRDNFRWQPPCSSICHSFIWNALSCIRGTCRWSRGLELWQNKFTNLEYCVFLSGSINIWDHGRKKGPSAFFSSFLIISYTNRLYKLFFYALEFRLFIMQLQCLNFKLCNILIACQL